MKRMAGLVGMFWLAVVGFGGERVVLEDFGWDRGNYRITLGQEFPGARGKVEWSGEKCLTVAYDFSTGGNYIGWFYESFIPDRVRKVEVRVLTDRAIPVSLRLGDSSGQTHQFQKQTLGKKAWETLVYEVPETSGQHWGGKNDGRVYQPLGWIMIGIERPAPGATGVVKIDDLAVETDLTKEAITGAGKDYFWAKAAVSLDTSILGNLFYPTDPVKGIVRVSAPPVPMTLTVTGKIFNAKKEKVGELPAGVLSEKNGYKLEVNLPHAIGYYQVLLRVSEGTQHRLGEGRYGVIPANPAMDRLERESPFGTQTHFNQWWRSEVGRIVKRAGIGWIREGEARLEDNGFPVAVENKLGYLPCFTVHRDPGWIKKGPDGKWDFKAVAEFHRQYAKKYGSYVDYYDLMNEPQSAWAAKFGGSWNGGEWQKVFVEYGKAMVEAIKAGDPGAKVMWEDLDVLMYYRQFFELGAGKWIDLISPHAYNLHPARWDPEAQPILEQTGEFKEFVRKNQLGWTLWHGEVGFTTYRMSAAAKAIMHQTTCYYPCTELEQAQRLVRMMVLHLSRGVEKIFWYDFQDDGTDPENCEHNFGLIRHDWSPKPAMVAYSILIDKLRGGRWLGRYLAGGGADVYVYAAAKSDRPVLIGWLRKGYKAEMLRVPGQTRSVTVTDIFGHAETAAVKNHELTVKFTETPVYIEGLTMEDVKGFVEKVN